MTIPLAQIVETKELVETILFSVVAGIGLTSIFSLAIWGVARYVDLSQEDRPVAAGVAAATAGSALLLVLAIVVVAVVVMTSK